MAKTRLSISLDEEQAERIRAYAERSGMDISSYMVNAAAHQMNALDAAEAQFAHLDALSEQAAAEEFDSTDVVDDAALTVQDQADIQAFRELLLGPQETEHDKRMHVA